MDLIKLDVSKLDFRLYIKRPRGSSRRVTFGIYKRPVRGGKSVTISHSDLDGINAKFRAGVLDYKDAERQVELLRASLYRAAGAKQFKLVSNSANAKLLDAFWADEYQDRMLVDAGTAYNDYRRAVNACGELSIQTATTKEMQALLNKSYKGQQHRRIVARLNTIFKWLGRDVRLRAAKPERRAPAYLTEGEVLSVLPHIESESFKLLVQAGFYTGCRLGELYALNDLSFRADSYLLVSSQLDREGQYRDTKTREQREAYVFPNGRDAVRRWIAALPTADKINERGRASKLLKRACKSAMPKRPDKWICFHDLRHSYAIEFLRVGAPLKKVAESMGNSELVCERYYSGFRLKKEDMESLDRLFNKPKIDEKER